MNSVEPSPTKPVRTPAKAPAQDIDDALYEKRQKIYPREVHGIFATARVAAASVLLGIFYLLPGSSGTAARPCCSTCRRASSTCSA